VRQKLKSCVPECRVLQKSGSINSDTRYVGRGKSGKWEVGSKIV
jgi:hypothetical protein